MATYDIYMATHALCGCLTNFIVYNGALKGGDTVKIEIQVDENTPDMDILITCKKLTPKVEKILAILRMIDHQITGKIGGETLIRSRKPLRSCCIT